ncbi:hypothetical protein ES705_19276 [subsurface metagenome]
MGTTLELLEKKAEERYYKEHERNTQINNSLSIPIGIIVALLGVVGFFLVSFPFKIINTPIVWVILCLFIVGLVTLIYYISRAIYFLSKVFLGLKYAYIPNPKRICIYAKQLAKYYKSQQVQNIDEVVEKEVREYLAIAYSRTAYNNSRLNELKGFYLTKAKKYIILTIVVFMVSSIPFVVLHYCDKNLSSDVQNVEIVGDADG